MFELYLFVKRVADSVLSLIGMLLLSPIFIVIILAIKFESRGPVFFKQKRLGKGKSYFEMLKFRTMRMDTPKDTPTHLLKNPEQYITMTGKLLRKYSLDELPQFWNIFVGDMSIIGPRPALWNQDDLIVEREKYGVNNIKPGLTGWAQINGRDELPISEKANLDGVYAQKMSLGFDIKCFFMTIIKVLKSDGFIEGAVTDNNNETDATDKEYVITDKT